MEFSLFTITHLNTRVQGTRDHTMGNVGMWRGGWTFKDKTPHCSRARISPNMRKRHIGPGI